MIGVDGDDGEWVWETEKLSLHKRVGGKDSDSDGLCLLLVRHLEQPPGVLVGSLNWECRMVSEQRKKASRVGVEVERRILERYAI